MAAQKSAASSKRPKHARAPRAESLSQHAYNEIRCRILDGRFHPGERLVRRTLAEELDISPIPLTEALFRLEEDGLVESEPGVGSKVKEWTPAKLRNDQIIREALECQAARLCAVYATDDELAHLIDESKVLDRVMSAKNDEELEAIEKEPGEEKYSMLGDRFRIHMRFHMMIARLSGYSALRLQIEQVWLRHATFFKWNPREAFSGIKRESPPLDWHESLARTLAARDPDRAEAHMRRHVTFNQQRDIDLIIRAQLRE